MNKDITNEFFDIHKKIKDSNNKWAYSRSAQPYQDGSDYEFCTCLIGVMEHAIYERRGKHFILIDFFENYSDACPKAKAIIDKYPDLKRQFSH